MPTCVGLDSVHLFGSERNKPLVPNAILLPNPPQAGMSMLLGLHVTQPSQVCKHQPINLKLQAAHHKDRIN